MVRRLVPGQALEVTAADAKGNALSVICLHNYGLNPESHAGSSSALWGAFVPTRRQPRTGSRASPSATSTCGSVAVWAQPRAAWGARSVGGYEATHMRLGMATFGLIDRIWTTGHKSRLMVGRPIVSDAHPVEWRVREVLSDHSALALYWPTRRALPLAIRPLLVHIAARPLMARAPACPAEAARPSEAFVARPVDWWRQLRGSLVLFVTVFSPPRPRRQGRRALRSCASSRWRAHVLLTSAVGALRRMRAHWQEFDEVFATGGDIFVLRNAAAYEQRLAAAASAGLLRRGRAAGTEGGEGG